MELPGKDIYGVGLDSSVRKIQMDFRQYVAKSKGGLAIPHLKKIFKQYDLNGNGQLEPDEFEKALNAFGLFLKKYEYQLIFKYYDKDNSGTLDFNEFLDGIRMPMNERRDSFVRKIFAILDRDSTGQIGIEDISNRVSFSTHNDVVNNIRTENEMKQTFLGQFEGNSKDGQVSLEEFINYYQDISMGIPNDQYFIQLLEEQWLVVEDDSQQLAQQVADEVIENLRKQLIQLSAGNKDDVIIRKIFQQYDINKDGFLGLDEFVLMLQKLGIQFNRKYISLSFQQLDTNRSGFIEFQEFFDFIVHGVQQQQQTK